MSRAGAIAAARLQRSEKRTPVAAQQRVEDARGVYEEAYAACEADDFERALALLKAVHEQDEGLHFEAKAAPGMLMVGKEGSTMLHLAASKGSLLGARDLLRIGANAAQKDAGGQSSIDLAVANGHMELAQMLRAHDEAWAGWGIVEISCLACLYLGEHGFADAHAYLRRILERDHAKHGVDGAGSLFRRALPSGLCMLDIARHMDTRGAHMVREAFAVEATELAQDDEASSELEAAQPAVQTEEASHEWPEDGWVPPCSGYMVCALCAGKSGVAGRWGAAGDDLALWRLRYPLLVCLPCQQRCGLENEEAPVACWVNKTLLLDVRDGDWGSRVAQLVHPQLGEIAYQPPSAHGTAVDEA